MDSIYIMDKDELLKSYPYDSNLHISNNIYNDKIVNSLQHNPMPYKNKSITNKFTNKVMLIINILMYVINTLMFIINILLLLFVLYIHAYKFK